MKRCPIILIDRSVNAGIVGFRGSTQPTGGNPTKGSNHLFNDLETLRQVEQEILQRGVKTGIFRETERYGLRFDKPIGYRIDKSGNIIPLHYGELKIKPNGEYHIVPRTGATKK